MAITDAVDAVQVDNPLGQNFDEDDILGEESDGNKGKKAKQEDEFGMSSDEEQELAKRKQLRKEKEAAE